LQRADSVDDVLQLVGVENAAGPAAVLRVIRELHGIERPHIDAEPAHWKHGRAVARVTENHMRLNTEDVVHDLFRDSDGALQDGMLG
jgi:hypothetical protein